MGILGIYASSVLKVTNSYESIATYTLGSAQSSVTFSSIPSTYKQLQLRLIARASGSGGSFVSLKVNGDTSNGNYARHLLVGDGANANAYANVGTATNLGKIADSSNSANIFGTFVLDILDYTNTNKNTTFRSLGGFDGNGGGEVDFNSIVWLNTSAISSITLTEVFGTNFTANSQFALYGIKG
jgi:hypothetical protein